MNRNLRWHASVQQIGCCVAALLASWVLASCGSPSKNLQLAKDSVGVFHAQLDTEQYDSIYAGTDDGFRKLTSQTDFVKLLQAIHNKLGTVQQADLRNTGVAWYAGQGATVTLVYDTKFRDGAGSEQFVWHIKDNQASLYGYHINSNDLITK
jgi:hypothetical protein